MSPNPSKSDNTVTFPDHGDLSLLDNLKDDGAEVKNLLDHDPYLHLFYVPQHLLPSTKNLKCDKNSRRISWIQTKSSKLFPVQYHLSSNLSITLANPSH